MNDKLRDEIRSFDTLWKGGFRTGYDVKRNQRGLERYLKRNLPSNCCLLEIGCGGGQWSEFIYPLVNKMYCIDVLSEYHNRFWMRIGEDKKDKISYCQVADFSLSCIPDDSIDYVFAYDVFCHISRTGVEAYLKSLYPKCNRGAILNIMYADPRKYLGSEPENIGHVKMYLPPPHDYGDIDELIGVALKDADGSPSIGRWYWVGIDGFVKLCKRAGYEVIDRDLNIDKTNPITLMRKP